MIKSKLLSIWVHLTATVIVLWRHLPRVALYTVAFFAIFTVGDRIFYKLQPADYFVQYTSFIVQNSREGEDVPFTLCRSHRSDYEVSGLRTIYVVPAGQTVAQKVFVHNDRLNGLIAGANCANYFIKNSDFHHPLGQYQMTINVQFTVNYGERKQITVQSNVYRIYPNNDPDTVQVQINNLRAEVDQLQQKLQNIGVQYNIPLNAPIKPAPTSNAGEASPTTGNSSAGSTAPSNVTPAGQAPKNSGTHEVCTTDILGIKLGCQQVPN